MNSEANGCMPAMPLDNNSEKDIHAGYGAEYIGLSKREHFAGLAMQGLLSNNKSTGEDLYKEMAGVSVFAADALLAALEQS